MGYVELAKGKVHDLFNEPQFGHVSSTSPTPYIVGTNITAGQT